MEIKVVRVYLTGAKRINELFEEGARKDKRIEELDKALHYKQLQHKGYAKELEKQLRQIEELKAEAETARAQRDEWARLYHASEEARQSLGEKLKNAIGALELLREKGTHPSPQLAAATPPPAGEALAADSRPYSNYGPLGPMKGGISA